MTSLAIRARFFRHITIIPWKCWEWSNSNSAGYGTFWMERRMYYAHRVSWFISTGKWPTNLVLHKCDNRKCVRPDHLFEGTYSDNMIDCVEKGRYCKNRPSKISKQYVTRIRALRGKVSQGRLAKIFGVRQSYISRIQSGKRRGEIV